ncbi:MAG: cbb3-type cytochrome c oxidase subunit I [Calditrichia bacterium]
MSQGILDRLFEKKKMFVAFWTISIAMVAALIYYSATLIDEVPPLPEKVVSQSGEVLYTKADIVEGKGYFQQFDLMDYGTMLGMGAYLGPDYSTLFMHKRATYLYDYYSQEMFGKPFSALNNEEQGAVKARVIREVKQETVLTENGVTYSEASAEAYKQNKQELIQILVNGDPENAFPGGVIRKDEAEKIAAFFDWGQLVASSLRPGKNITWSNNWPPEPLLDQGPTYSSVKWSLWQMLLLWVLTIAILFIIYEYFFKKDEGTTEKPLNITSLFPSQKKLIKYIPIITIFFFVQVVLGGYLAHIYTDPANNFLISQKILPFNAIRAIHINMAIIWIAVGWLVGGLFIAPLVSKSDLKYPWLVDVLWMSLVIIGVGGIAGIYMGATGQLRDVWFWLGNEGREYLNLGRVWDIALVAGLVMWFLMVFSTIRKAKSNNILVGTIIWSAFGVATLYMAGMAPLHKIMPNYTVDDYYRWWVIHLWVELTFELFAAGVLAYWSVLLGLVSRQKAERILLLELILVAMSGTLGVAHHYWWQGLDEYWIAIGSIFSALEPVPLVVLMIEAWKEYREIKRERGEFEYTLPFMWLTAGAFLNWYGAGFLGMVINLPIVNYYSHGTYLIMPHGHVALLGAFGYLTIAFIYSVARAYAKSNNIVWNESLSKWGFWLVTLGIVLFSIPTLVIGFEQTRIAYEMGYYFTRIRENLDHLNIWMWIRVIPDTMIIIGALLIVIDTLKKTFLGKKVQGLN